MRRQGRGHKAGVAALKQTQRAFLSKTYNHPSRTPIALLLFFISSTNGCGCNPRSMDLLRFSSRQERARQSQATNLERFKSPFYCTGRFDSRSIHRGTSSGQHTSTAGSACHDSARLCRKLCRRLLKPGPAWRSALPDTLHTHTTDIHYPLTRPPTHPHPLGGRQEERKEKRTPPSISFHLPSLAQKCTAEGSPGFPEMVYNREKSRFLARADKQV
mmetsp:Transcript_46111/g.90874  ORF Transcript_46111/g.90874 Transcript_46111/m.90874 type:complete len:216 (-) Transcript_46111:594-1241(-)